MKIIVTDCATLRYNNDLSLDIYENFGQVEYYENLTHDELLEKCIDVDIILCNKTPIDREVMVKAQRLKYIGLFATGYNNIDITCAIERGITVCNAGSYSTNAVAQQVFAYILNHFTALTDYNAHVKSGGWIRSATFSQLCFSTDELDGKKIGIIGFGSIGQKVAKIAQAFDMQVLVYTRTPRTADGVNFVSFDELLTKSDIVTVHCPLNAQSEKMFNADTFGKMKKGAFFVNTSRGGVLDEQSLFDALENGQLSGAAVDVLQYEPMRTDCPLLNAKSITITPHTAWAPYTTRLRLVHLVYDNIKAFLNGTPQNVVSK